MIETLDAYAVYKVGRFEEAYRRWRTLAEKGNVQGMLKAANMLMAEQGPARDPAAAVAWCERAAERDDPQAGLALSHAHRKGTGVEADTGAADRLFVEAARLERFPARLTPSGVGKPRRNDRPARQT